MRCTLFLALLIALVGQTARASEPSVSVVEDELAEVLRPMGETGPKCAAFLTHSPADLGLTWRGDCTVQEPEDPPSVPSTIEAGETSPGESAHPMPPSPLEARPAEQFEPPRPHFIGRRQSAGGRGLRLYRTGMTLMHWGLVGGGGVALLGYEGVYGRSGWAGDGWAGWWVIMGGAALGTVGAASGLVLTLAGTKRIVRTDAVSGPWRSPLWPLLTVSGAYICASGLVRIANSNEEVGSAVAVAGGSLFVAGGALMLMGRPADQFGFAPVVSRDRYGVTVSRRF